jgi:GNAT superfamily N-acetyltransferase
MDLIVRTDWRRRGLGARLLDVLIEHARSAGATSLQARPYADSADALSLLTTRGFRETMRMTGLALDDVRQVDLRPFSAIEPTLATRGVRVTSLAAELRTDARAWEKLRDANVAAEFGWPDPDPPPSGKPPEPETVDQFRARAREFQMIEDACFIAALGDAYVGYSALAMADAARTRGNSGGTAVRPEYRGLGLATALKARCVRWAQENGLRTLITSSGNAAMVHVNEKFGFRRTYVEVRLVRRPV